MSQRIALFPGSFDPFTVGHDSIVRRALTMFDEIVIGIGYNINKHSFIPPEQRLETIAALYAHDDRIKVYTYSDLTIDLAQRVGANFIVRGIRSVKDFEYERDIASINQKLIGIETVLLFTEARYAHISSSVVCELMSYGKDVSDFLPRPQE